MRAWAKNSNVIYFVSGKKIRSRGDKDLSGTAINMGLKRVFTAMYSMFSSYLARFEQM